MTTARARPPDAAALSGPDVIAAELAGDLPATLGFFAAIAADRRA